MNTFSERVRLTRKAIPEEHCNYREACNSHFYKPILLLVILAFCLVSLFWGNRANFSGGTLVAFIFMSSDKYPTSERGQPSKMDVLSIEHQRQRSLYLEFWFCYNEVSYRIMILKSHLCSSRHKKFWTMQIFPRFPTQFLVAIKSLCDLLTL